MYILRIEVLLAGEIASSAPAAIADAARKLLLEKVSPAFPCSRLALGATDFQKAPLKEEIHIYVNILQLRYYIYCAYILNYL